MEEVRHNHQRAAGLDSPVLGSTQCSLWADKTDCCKGLQVENPKILILTVGKQRQKSEEVKSLPKADWDDVQDHKNFVNSEAYKPFTAELAEIFDFEAMPPSICKAFTSQPMVPLES